MESPDQYHSAFLNYPPGRLVHCRRVYATIGANSYQGAAYVFTEPVGGWASEPAETQAAKLTASDGAASDSFGNSVAVSGGTVVGGAIGANRAQGKAYVFASPSYHLTGISSPRRGSCWRAGSVVTATTGLGYAGGTSVPGWLAGVSAGRQVRVRASGAQQLGTHCLRYDSADQEFTYRWKLSARGTGRVRMQVQLTYRSITSTSEQITVGRSR